MIFCKTFHNFLTRTELDKMSCSLDRMQCQLTSLSLLHRYAVGISSREVDKSQKTTLRDPVILRYLANAYHSSDIA